MLCFKYRHHRVAADMKYSCYLQHNFVGIECIHLMVR